MESPKGLTMEGSLLIKIKRSQCFRSLESPKVLTMEGSSIIKIITSPWMEKNDNSSDELSPHIHDLGLVKNGNSRDKSSIWVWSLMIMLTDYMALEWREMIIVRIRPANYMVLDWKE